MPQQTLTDDDLCALEFAVEVLRAIAERRQLQADAWEPVNDIRAASARAKHALHRVEPVVRKLTGETPRSDWDAEIERGLREYHAKHGRATRQAG
jgi:hypothetical protein